MAEATDTLEAEVWKPVPGYEGQYEVSSFGRARSLPRMRHCGKGSFARIEGRLLKLRHRSGYPIISLPKGKIVYVHRMVCEAFHGPAPEGKRQVAHFDGDKTNNHANNLRWADWKDNRKDGARLGEILTGENHGGAILTEADVVRIRELHARGHKMRAIGREFGICHQHVGDIIRRRIWKCV